MVFDAATGPGFVVGMSDMGDRFRLVLNEIDVVAADEPLPRLPVARAVWEPRPDLRTSAETWIMAGGPHHTVLSTALGHRDRRRPGRTGPHRAAGDRRGHHLPAVRP
jgi:L-arabinose isomerase